MATRPVGIPKLSRRSRMLLIAVGAVIVTLIVGARLVDTYVNWLWFGGVGYRGVFSTIVLTKITLFVLAGVFLGGVLGLNLWLAYRNRPVFVPVSGPDDPLSRYRTVLSRRSGLIGIGIPVAVGVIGGLAATGDWQMVQLFLHSTPFGVTDPEFGHDVSFYTFELPFYRWLLAWGFVAVTLSFFAALITHYLFGGIRLAGRSVQLSVPARIQLAVLAGVFVLLKAVDFFFDRYGLLTSQRSDLFTGATYTDLHAVMPSKLILMCIAVICAIAFFAAVFLRNLQIPAVATVLLVLSSLVVGALWPALLQQFSVEPNAKTREAKSIARNLEATKQAFGITDKRITRIPYAGTTNVSAEEVAQDKGTVSNIRLLDPNLLSETFTQLKQQYNFYGFPEELDIGRYRTDSGELQAYLVAVRGINTDGLAANQQSWINRHMVYTHGNGFISAPADKVNSVPGQGSDTSGYPVFSVSDVSNNGKGRIPVEQPRVYYGELIKDYAIVGAKPGAKPMEYDTATSRYTYQGSGGVPIGNWFNRLAFAAYYGEQNFLFNQEIGSYSQVIFKRNPRERVKEIAPWLQLDGDSYPAVIDGDLKWILDGYTTLDNYPYSQLVSFGEAASDSSRDNPQPDNKINYIRNSVKITVDAYTGKVTFYEFGKRDPVLEAWQGIFPGMIKPESAIPDKLRKHFRYPADLFKVQRSLLTKYHVDNPSDFYTTRGFWEVPEDPNDSDKGKNPNEKQPPFYILAQVPEQSRPTFQLTSPLTALERPNLAAWVSVSSAPETYGQFTVLKLPTESQTPGPVQVQRKMETEPKVARDSTLFKNPKVEPLFGNLLTLPIKGGLLYVEPIYIQPQGKDAFPRLARVLVSFGGDVGYAPTIGEALEQVFGPGAGESANTAADDSEQSTGDTTEQPPQQPSDPSSPEVAAAIADVQAAMEAIRQAQQSGNLGDLGQAFQQLDKAMQRFEQATSSGG